MILDMRDEFEQPKSENINKIVFGNCDECVTIQPGCMVIDEIDDVNQSELRCLLRVLKMVQVCWAFPSISELRITNEDSSFSKTITIITQDSIRIVREKETNKIHITRGRIMTAEQLNGFIEIVRDLLKTIRERKHE